jgi:SpoVK/Ycf46/Vps4 family AAA+-type ATPase
VSCASDCEQTIREISTDEYTNYYTPADIKGIVTTAYLTAVRRYSTSKIGSAIDSTKTNSITEICSNDLWNAYKQSQPSLSRADKMTFDLSYSKFIQKSIDDSTNNTIDVNCSKVSTTSSKSDPVVNQLYTLR